MFPPLSSSRSFAHPAAATSEDMRANWRYHRPGDTLYHDYVQINDHSARDYERHPLDNRCGRLFDGCPNMVLPNHIPPPSSFYEPLYEYSPSDEGLLYACKPYRPNNGYLSNSLYKGFVIPEQSEHGDDFSRSITPTGAFQLYQQARRPSEYDHYRLVNDYRTLRDDYERVLDILYESHGRLQGDANTFHYQQPPDVQRYGVSHISPHASSPGSSPSFDESSTFQARNSHPSIEERFPPSCTATDRYRGTRPRASNPATKWNSGLSIGCCYDPYSKRGYDDCRSYPQADSRSVCAQGKRSRRRSNEPFDCNISRQEHFRGYLQGRADNELAAEYRIGVSRYNPPKKHFQRRKANIMPGLPKRRERYAHRNKVEVRPLGRARMSNKTICKHSSRRVSGKSKNLGQFSSGHTRGSVDRIRAVVPERARAIQPHPLACTGTTDDFGNEALLTSSDAEPNRLSNTRSKPNDSANESMPMTPPDQESTSSRTVTELEKDMFSINALSPTQYWEDDYERAASTSKISSTKLSDDASTFRPTSELCKMIQVSNAASLAQLPDDVMQNPWV